jgi:uncharacterized protein YdeI (YjbR/CyaY-like superfamily)
MSARFFATPAEWRAWLMEHHPTETELLVGFYKKGCGRPSITWPESVDAALCFGWIDGVRRNIDSESYSIRFTPRRRGSNWSNVNIRRVKELADLGLMHSSGLAAFETRGEERSGVYSFEQKAIELEPVAQKRFEAKRAAWAFFQSQAPWYQRAAKWWVISAKREETREKRLNELIACSHAKRPIPSLDRSASKKESGK